VHKYGVGRVDGQSISAWLADAGNRRTWFPPPASRYQSLKRSGCRFVKRRQQLRLSVFARDCLRQAHLPLVLDFSLFKSLYYLKT
jgi:hypothetical protein